MGTRQKTYYELSFEKMKLDDFTTKTEKDLTARKNLSENLESKGIGNKFAENKNENGKSTNKARMDNREAMVSSSLRELVDRPEKRSGIYRTVEAGNTAGSVSAILEPEELEELESREINPYWLDAAHKTFLTIPKLKLIVYRSCPFNSISNSPLVYCL
jgi:hypothetical protein